MNVQKCFSPDLNQHTHTQMLDVRIYRHFTIALKCQCQEHAIYTNTISLCIEWMAWGFLTLVLPFAKLPDRCHMNAQLICAYKHHTHIHTHSLCISCLLSLSLAPPPTACYLMQNTKNHCKPKNGTKANAKSLNADALDLINNSNTHNHRWEWERIWAFAIATQEKCYR